MTDGNTCAMPSFLRGIGCAPSLRLQPILPSFEPGVVGRAGIRRDALHHGIGPNRDLLRHHADQALSLLTAKTKTFRRLLLSLPVPSRPFKRL